MTIKSDRWIRRMATEHAMITPFVAEQQRGGIISYGLSSYGYDIRVADEFKVFTNVYNVVVDPKNFSPRSFVDFQGEYCDIPPHSFALARSVERLKISRNVLCTVLGKSSYARCGIIVNVTPLEPEWEGYITIEISNTTPLPARIYANEGIAQVLFFESDEACETSYADKSGKYQGQVGVVLPRIDSAGDDVIRAFAERLVAREAFSTEEWRQLEQMVASMPLSHPLLIPLTNVIFTANEWAEADAARADKLFVANTHARETLRKALQS